MDLEEKIKFIIIGLGATLVITIFMFLLTAGAKKAIERERNELKNTNEVLTQKIEESLKERKQLQEKINALNSDLDRISQEKEELQKRKEEIQKLYEAIVKERDELKEKLKTPGVTAQGEGEAVATKEEAYWAGVLKSKTDLSLQTENLRTELKTLQMDNEQLRSDLDNLTKEKKELEQQFSYNQKSFDNMSSQLVNMSSQLVIEKNAKFQLQDELKPIKNENAILRRQLKSLSTHRIKLENQLRQLQVEKSELERRLNEIELFLQDRVSRTKDIELKEKLDTVHEETIQPQKESIELPPIIVRPQTAPLVVTPAQTEGPITQEKGTQVYVGGSVLEVNKENNFVVIDLGQNTGIKIGDTFRVYREGKAIATIEVIQVRESVSACDIREEIASIEVGDTIR